LCTAQLGHTGLPTLYNLLTEHVQGYSTVNVLYKLLSTFLTLADVVNSGGIPDL